MDSVIRCSCGAVLNAQYDPEGKTLWLYEDDYRDHPAHTGVILWLRNAPSGHRSAASIEARPTPRVLGQRAKRQPNLRLDAEQTKQLLETEGNSLAMATLASKWGYLRNTLYKHRLGLQKRRAVKVRT